ncbi:DUF262 domain-containing protein [Clostridium botulinum]|uniref:DUF262 domain-containing protein n=1 Tax=Clostridium botulinum TaxID=1491 RepID=UPI000773404D|nr:DUF262 domain-containing protein [Clostridium botulinum]NFL36767.1 DUF262 domain-containing protein [Clostridium botulinum]NFL64553.1 DUF262 domain-containing protein [Clostridium botulinum]NFN06679.1 DUF262 domain-containing protein [Clostridium botulinum]NFN23543.1 DUF262 domain-containing protein [Clostridium botulinum]NFN30171.1 DUF262 domain-containing protein [Clostridium botulinum]
MAYEKKSIRSIIEDVNSRRIYLPAIQRKYVWADSQITRLMDSIMLGYPIGTFLFWKVKKTIVNQKEYSMYEFIKDYHDRDMYKNPAAPQPFPIGSGDETLWAVLDGQQRLTSLYIALQGSISRKLPNKRWKNDDAFPKKELYFDLHSEKTDDDDISYEFKFLTQEDASKNKNNKIWYLVKDILKYSAEDLLTDVIIPNGWATDKTATKNISLLHTRLATDEIINYFEVEKDSIDSVLDIFVRVNSGGTVLSKSDLLFSTIVSHWDKARDEIDKLLSEINKKGEGFNFTNDFIMRTCLYLLDMSVALKVETFKKDSVLKIKDNWNSIRQAIKDTVDLLNEFGFNSENIISYVAISPMVYYRFKGGKFDAESKCELRKYIVIAQVKQIFGTASNSALASIREALKAAPADLFKMSNLNSVRFTGDRTLRYTADEIDAMFDTYEIGAYTFMLLSLLYPNLKYSQKGFHQDHMHPHTGFEEGKINGLVLSRSSVIDEDTKEEWRRRRNTLANLQLLEGRENESKNATPLADWLKVDENSENAKYLPEGISYELSNFEEFMEKRQELMSNALKNILL